MASLINILAATTLILSSADAFSRTPIKHRGASNNNLRVLKSWNSDSNNWKNSDHDTATENWESTLKKKKDGSYWSDFESNDDTKSSFFAQTMLVDETESKLDTLASMQAEEVAFNIREANRADTLRRMEEWGFESSTIASALDVAVEERNEDELEGMQGYREASYLENEDPTVVESHTKVPKDPITNEPIRSQMVYVDEHACIGCTNCAMIAQSTFFMEEENGRARVFEQWGDDEQTIEIAMETCPVDCIHYVPYEELAQLEVQRRDQYINVLAGLVSRAERGAGSGLTSSTPRSFGSQTFTDAPKISRTYEGDNTEFEAKEKLRMFTDRRRKLEDERRRDNKIVDL